MDFKWHGSTKYSRAMEFQEDAMNAVECGSKGIVLGFEHPEVLTLGLRSRGLEDLLCMKHNFSIERVPRGGEATIHNEGQLVIYPVIPLGVMGLGARCFVDVLMKATADLLLSLGIQTHEKEEPGLYTENGKIAFFGLKIRKGITSHGLSLNVCNDLDVFQKISVCGVRGASLDKVENYNFVEGLEDLFLDWNQFFLKRFLTKCRETETCSVTPSQQN